MTKDFELSFEQILKKCKTIGDVKKLTDEYKKLKEGLENEINNS